MLEKYDTILEIGKGSSILYSVETYEPILENYETLLEIGKGSYVLLSVEK